MDIATEALAGGITKVTLRGRLDTTGAVLLELPFNKIATEQQKILVDLSSVSIPGLLRHSRASSRGQDRERQKW